MPSVASFATSSKSSINFSGTSMEVLDTGRKAASAKKNTTGPVATRCYKLKQVGKRLGSKVGIFFPKWLGKRLMSQMDLQFSLVRPCDVEKVGFLYGRLSHSACLCLGVSGFS